MDGARVSGAAMRRRERRLRSWAKHERLSIAMALAEKLHHSVQPVMEQYVVPRELKTASAREGEEYKKNALYEALRGQKTPLPGVRTVSTAPVPQVALPDLGGDVVHDDTLVAFLVRQTLLEKDEEKRKEEEEEVRKVHLAQVKAAKKELRERRQEMVDELVALRRNFLPSERTPSVERRIAQLVSALEASASSKPPTRKRKKRRRKRTRRSSHDPPRLPGWFCW